eukprot:COSAG02_NODE_24645_length_681_cov_1.735395_1_plen_66_part_01
MYTVQAPAVAYVPVAKMPKPGEPQYAQAVPVAAAVPVQPGMTQPLIAQQTVIMAPGQFARAPPHCC